MVAFTDSQLRAVWAAADRVPFEKRGVFVERVVARLRIQRRDQTFLPGLSLKLPDAEPDWSQTRAGGDEQTATIAASCRARSLRAAAEAPLFGLVIVLQRNHQSLHRPQRPQCDN
jgi:hypothetical protein